MTPGRLWSYLLFLTIGCGEAHPADDAGFDAGAEMALDAGRTDAGAPSVDANLPVDGGPPGSDACSASPERCDMIDNDCDEAVDEEPDALCGLANAEGSCVDGTCELASCAAGFDDCDGDPANGCESATATDPSTCGVCGYDCPTGDSCEDGICSSERVVSVSAGLRHSCALRASGEVVCWGANDLGQLGVGDTVDRPLPTRLAGPSDFVSIVAGNEYTCGIRAGGTVSCWGDNSRGQLGDGTTTTRLIAQPTLPIGEPVVELDLNPIVHAFTYARTSTGTVWGWGNNYYGQLDGATLGNLAVPSPRDIGWTEMAQCDLGSTFACCLDSLGMAHCRGASIPGDPSTQSWSDLRVGEAHACGHDATGFRCIGAGSFGETGPFPAGSAANGYDLGVYVTCLVDSTNTLQCSGLLPSTSVPIGNVLRVSIGNTRMCFLGDDGSVHCVYDALPGDGSTSVATSPAAVLLYPAR